MRNRLMTTVAILLVPAAFAEKAVTNEWNYTSSSAVTLRADATPVLTEAEFLTRLGTPSFWADASDRTLWKIADNGKVTNILDKAGSGRWVQSAKYAGTDYQTAKTAPTLVFDSSLGGGAYLDFGAAGTKSGLVFSPEPGTESTACPNGSNDLQRIGTVLMVLNSAKGGGNLLGDGAGYMTSMKSTWKFFSHSGQYGRGYDDVLNSRWSFIIPLFYQENSVSYARTTHSGSSWHNWGRPAKSDSCGWRGGWDVTAFRCRDTEGRATFFGNGGQGIAEIVFFDRVLTKDECLFAEAYLADKWFGVPSPGYGGTHRLGRLYASNTSASEPADLGYEVEVNVAAGETLDIATIYGGRGTKAAIVKTGAGTLSVGDAGDYGGTLRLEAGTLAFAEREIPSALPSNCFFHIDASATGALELDGDYVNFITNDTGVTKRRSGTSNKYTVSGMTPENEARRPTVIRNALGTGLHAIDLGKSTTAAKGGICLKAVTNYTGGAASKYAAATWSGVATVVAVIGAQQGGGNLSCARDYNTFNRLSRNPGSYANSLVNDGTYPGELPSAVWINGIRCADSGSYESPDYQVVAVQSDRGGFGYVGWTGNDARGGMRVCEMAFYMSPLSDTEIRDAQAYLLKKWFNRTAPGYRRPSESRAYEVASVEVTGDAAIDVAAGATLRVGKLAVDSGATVRKTGAGTLRVHDAQVAYGGTFSVCGGAAYQGDAADVSAKCEVASGSSVRLDASDTDSMVLTESGDLSLITYWNDIGHRNFARASAEGGVPYLDADTTLAGYATANFGTCGGSGATAPRSMLFNRSLDGIRSVYAVVKFTGNDDVILGSQMNTYEFIRGSGGALVYKSGSSSAVYNGEIHLDGGATTNGSVLVDTEDFHLVEIHTTSPVRADNLTVDRADYSKRAGGMRLAELIVYEHELTAREKVATRNALLKKWFGKAEAELADLPAAPASVESLPIAGSTTTVDGNTATNSVPAGLELAGDVAGEGTVVKEGAGTLVLRDLSQLDGTVAVAGGTLRLTGRLPYAEPALPKDGLLVHLDANVGVTTLANGNLDTWTDAEGGAYKAVGWRTNRANPYPATYDGDSRLTYMNVGKRGYYGASLRFQDETNGWACVTNVRAAFWVIGSQQGGGYLLGGASGTMSYHRVVSNFAAPLADKTYGADDFRDKAKARFFCNGQLVPDQKTTTGVLSGGWDVLSMSQTSKASGPLSVTGYAVSGRNLAGSQDETNSGFMNLGETLLYSRTLTDEEQLQVQAYLSQKWNIGNLVRGASDAAIDFAEGTILDCGGVTQRVAQVSGAGEITNGTVRVRKIVVDLANPKTLTAEDFVFDEGFSVELLNSGSFDEPIVLVAAENFGGIENLSKKAVTPAGRFTLKCRNGQLLLRPVKHFILMVR